MEISIVFCYTLTNIFVNTGLCQKQSHCWRLFKQLINTRNIINDFRFTFLFGHCFYFCSFNKQNIVKYHSASTCLTRYDSYKTYQTSNTVRPLSKIRVSCIEFFIFAHLFVLHSHIINLVPFYF